MKITDKQKAVVKQAVIAAVPVTLAETKNRVDLAFMVSCCTAYIALTGNLKHYKQFLKDFCLDVPPSTITEEIKKNESPKKVL